MTSTASTASLAVAAAALGLALAVIVGAWLSRRAAVRRLASVTSRLEGVDKVDLVGRGRLEGALAALERAAGTGAFEVNEAKVDVERFADALALIGQGLVVANEEGEVVFRNARARELIGDRLGEALTGQTVRRLLDAALQGAPATQMLDLFGPPRRTLELRAAPLADPSRSIGAAVVIEDVTDRRRLEAVRRDFVANISHELKTPVGALGLLAETIAAEDDPVVTRRLAERMHNEAFRVGRIIDDLLDLSRIEAEEAPLREPVPVHLVLAEAVDRVADLAERRHVTVDVGEPSHRLTVVGERRQLVSAVHNLVENAVKYSDEGSTVGVAVSTDGRRVEIEVSDHGIGIPVRDLERIFERFYRVDRARARDTGGTGLGLAIVRHVATNHGGDVRVTSQEGAGSTFTLTLPAGPGPVALSEKAG
ncbi:MAG TPA: ATP-binding protein [Acidimicrobiales bacterium]|nr:ATP-binding protein [Acidimicrobiales bacterium]